ncbi:NADPH:quinone oxidoreductase family protein [Georhizobium profundi]|uniref:NADPH:quinone oxidoreductase family protein n=1 Tax=Georhizobium profundi TaxID=2341112 RepID=A0A3Q8XQD5_9HYPH|nr:NADPH:quinone oxidoreductase family protein [Georhizobium profundi]AZN71451.1 NADPH:quinone oxidoreductase family protein [Georhizobium profundi]
MTSAIVCHAFGPLDQLRLETVKLKALAADEVQVKAEAIGVNYPDGLLVQGLYQMKPLTPFTPGMEVAGTITALGDNVDGFAIGDRVAALLATGGYASEIVTDPANLIALPEHVSFNDACALLCAYGTSHHALKQRASLQSGETLLVLGAAGSTGIAAIQIGKAMGAHVIAVASSEDKRALAEANGADVVLGYDGLKDAVKQETDGRGVDVVFDPVGGDAFDTATRLMARRGRLLVVGFAAGRIPSFPVNLALVKEFAVVGVFWGNFIARERALHLDNMRELFAWHADGRVKPHIGDKRSLNDAAAVLSEIMQRGARGKTVLVP